MELYFDQQEKVDKTIAFVKHQLADAEGGHDWWHAYRVRNTAVKIAREENADLFIVELAAWLHDIADPKFHDGDEKVGPLIAQRFLKSLGIPDEITEHIINIIRNISFKNSFGLVDYHSLEMDVVQDADRLDAIGAIGIARAFSYGGYQKRLFYDPEILPNPSLSKEEYKNSKAPTINHFYEKLLLLKDKMNTKSGKQMAEERHHFMEVFLQRFFREWGGR